MKTIFAFALLTFVSIPTFACGTDAQHHRMAGRLYEDADMQKFVCGTDTCAVQEFESGLQFTQHDESYHGKALSVCLVEPKLSATNSYTGVFVNRSGNFEFQLISYGTGVKVGVAKSGVPMILEYSVNDPDNPDDSINQYLWNGKNFIFSRSFHGYP